VSGFGLEFDGLNDYIIIPNTNSLNVIKNITLEAWIYPYSIPWISPIISKGTNFSNFSYFLGIGQYYSNGEINFHLKSNKCNKLWLNSNFPLNSEEWYYIVVTHNGNSSKIYVNGILNNVASYFDDFINDNNFSVLIGTFNDYSDYFHGIIDEINIYNGSLDSIEIYNRYHELFDGYDYNLIVKNNDIQVYNESNQTNKDTPGFHLILMLISLIIIYFYKKY